MHNHIKDKKAFFKIGLEKPEVRGKTVRKNSTEKVQRKVKKTETTKALLFKNYFCIS